MEGRIEKLVPKSGLVERCEECGRVLYNNHCVVHVDADSTTDFRLKGKLEGAERYVVLNRELAEDILGITLDEAQALPQQDLTNVIRNKFVGNRFKFQGRTLHSNFIVNDYERRQ